MVIVPYFDSETVPACPLPDAPRYRKANIVFANQIFDNRLFKLKLLTVIHVFANGNRRSDQNIRRGAATRSGDGVSVSAGCGFCAVARVVAHFYHFSRQRFFDHHFVLFVLRNACAIGVLNSMVTVNLLVVFAGVGSSF